MHASRTTFWFVDTHTCRQTRWKQYQIPAFAGKNTVWEITHCTFKLLKLTIWSVCRATVLKWNWKLKIWWQWNKNVESFLKSSYQLSVISYQNLFSARILRHETQSERNNTVETCLISIAFQLPSTWMMKLCCCCCWRWADAAGVNTICSKFDCET